MRSRGGTWLLGAALGLASIGSAGAQVKTPAPAVVAGAKAVTVERITVHSPAITGNLEGNSPDRAVIVILPPGYRASPGKRYPVVYALHGYSASSNGSARSMCRRPSRARSPRVSVR